MSRPMGCPAIRPGSRPTERRRLVAVVTAARIGCSSTGSPSPPGGSHPAGRWVLPVSITFRFLPIGGTFDTFGAMWSSFRPLLDVDADGNAYVAFWAKPVQAPGRTRISPGRTSRSSRAMRFRRTRTCCWRNSTARGLTSGHGWSGPRTRTSPIALRAFHGEVAVVGRARPSPGRRQHVSGTHS